MKRLTTSIDIMAAPSRVWQVMFDVERWHEWTPSIERIQRLDEGPLTVNSRVKICQPKFPPAIWVITDVQPEKSFTWISTGPGLRVVATHAIALHGEHCHVTLTIEQSGLLGNLLGRLTQNLTERYMAFEAHGLKRRSEDPDFYHCQDSNEGKQSKINVRHPE